MKWVIWNKTTDEYYQTIYSTTGHWVSYSHAQHFQTDELEELLKRKWFGNEEEIVAVVAVAI
jgi:hypothetical protein